MDRSDKLKTKQKGRLTTKRISSNNSNNNNNNNFQHFLQAQCEDHSTKDSNNIIPDESSHTDDCPDKVNNSDNESLQVYDSSVPT